MASGSQNMTTYNARTVTGSNSAASPAGALLLSGAGRADDVTGDTWIFVDSHEGTSAPYGIKHDQANNKIHIYGNSTDSVWTRMDTGDTYILGKVGIGYDPETSENLYKLYVNGTSNFSDTIFFHKDGSLQIFTQTNSQDYADGNTENVCIQTSFDDHDYTYQYFSTYLNRVNLLLQPKGGQVYIGSDLTDLGNTNYKLHVNGSSYFSDTIHLPNGLLTGNRVSGTGSGIEINDDGGIEIFHTSTPFIDFHYQASTADYSVRLICNSATSLKCTGSFTANGNITADGGMLKSTANGNTITIGSQNTGFCHFESSANIPFYFNRTTLIDGDLGDTNYPVKNIIMGKSNGAGIYYQGSKANYRMIRFIDNTGDNYGNGISIGGGGQTIIGGGESADTAAAQVGTGGSEIMYVCNDGNVDIISNLQNGWDSRKVMTFNIYGYLMLSSYINSPTSNNENPTVSQFIVTNGSDHYYRKASTAHAMAAIRGAASGTWGISINGRLVDSAHSWTATEVYNYMTARMLKAGDTMSGVLHSSYKSGTWVNSLTNSAITIDDTAGSYGGWICGPTKNGRIAISTYQYSDDILYIGYGERGRTTNSFTRQMTWNGANGRLTTASVANAIWNDIAESRASDTQIPGYVIVPGEDKIAHITTKRLQSAGRIISDTYGYLLGDEDSKHAPVAIAGRVLAYPLHDKSYYEVGDAVCAAEGGKIDKMTREEIMMYPDRIIGIINEIPDYDIWEPSREGGGREPIHTNGRIWIDVR